MTEGYLLISALFSYWAHTPAEPHRHQRRATRLTNETMILSGFLDQLSALLHRKLVAIEQLRARHDISYKVEASGRPMLLKLVDATSTDVTTRQRKNSFEQQLQCIIDEHMISFAKANAES